MELIDQETQRFLNEAEARDWADAKRQDPSALTVEGPHPEFRYNWAALSKVPTGMWEVQVRYAAT